MIKILFVCHGNICRSPMAEFVLKDIVKKAGMSICGPDGDAGRMHGADQCFLIESAATSSEEVWNGRGNPVYPPALKTLKKHGIGVPGNELGVSAKRARKITAGDYEKYDHIICMDNYNVRSLMRMTGGDPMNKVSMLMDYTERPGEVPDPWYTGEFESTWRDVLEGCTELFYSVLENRM